MNGSKRLSIADLNGECVGLGRMRVTWRHIVFWLVTACL